VLFHRHTTGDRECCAPASLLRDALCKNLISYLTTSALASIAQFAQSVVLSRCSPASCLDAWVSTSARSSALSATTSTKSWSPPKRSGDLLRHRHRWIGLGKKLKIYLTAAFGITVRLRLLRKPARCCWEIGDARRLEKRGVCALPLRLTDGWRLNRGYSHRLGLDWAGSSCDTQTQHKVAAGPQPIFEAPIQQRLA
jgi:hypothetical protein